MKINTIVFSKDRACQLHLLLETLYKFYPDLFNVNVLWKASSCDFLSGYDRCIREFPQVNFVQELCMERDLLSLVDSEYDLTMFLTDDSFFYNRTPKIDRRIEIASTDPHFACYSFRIGGNMFNLNGDFVAWAWRNYCGGYLDYPLSLDAHVFKTDNILSLLKQVELIMPNIIEGQLMGHCKDQINNVMFASSQSSLVTCPVNRVQDVFTNWHGNTFPRHQEELNKEYINGKKINIDKLLQNINVTSPHQEFQFELD